MQGRDNAAVFPPSFLQGFVRHCLDARLGVRSVILYAPSRGRLKHDFTKQRRTNLYSGAKTVTALAVGIALGEGRLTLDTRLLDLFPLYRGKAADMVDQIMLRHLLAMRAGKHARLFKTTARKHAVDYLDVFMREPLDAKPGTTFFYNNASSYLLGRAVEAVSGERLHAYVRSRLFAPLNIRESVWHACPLGHTLGFTELYMTADDFAEIGRLLLEKGEREDCSIVPASFIEAMHTDIMETGHWDEPELEQGYGYQCWIGTIEGSFRADGLYGQYAVVSPAHDAVVTVTAHNINRPYDIIRAMHTEIFDRIDQLEE